MGHPQAVTHLFPEIRQSGQTDSSSRDLFARIPEKYKTARGLPREGQMHFMEIDKEIK